MADKVAEILSSGKLQKAIEVCNDEKAKVVDLFNRSMLFIHFHYFRPEKDYSPVVVNLTNSTCFQFGELAHRLPSNGTIKE